MELKGFHFDFIGKMRLFVILSLVLTSGGLFLLGTRGLNYGIDFKGGLKLQYQFSNVVTESDARSKLSSLGLGEFSVQKIGRPEEHRLIINVAMEAKPDASKPESGGSEGGLSKKITESLQQSIGGTIILEQEISVGPKAGGELRKKAVLAVVVSWLLILIYVGFRFDFYFAPGAIVALIHDVIIAMGAFAFSTREVSLTVIAAFLTIIGYSINDTIVIYDRIRENIPKMPRTPLREVINISINETFSRTIITSLTVLIVVVILFIFGEGDIQNFGFAMIFGTISGTYSTVFVATPCYIFLKEARIGPARIGQSKLFKKDK